MIKALCIPLCIDICRMSDFDLSDFTEDDTYDWPTVKDTVFCQKKLKDLLLIQCGNV